MSKDKSLREIDCGQVWKLNSKVDIYNLDPNTYFIVLSKDRDCWKIGNFWQFNKKWGGAKEFDLTDNEMRRNAIFCFDLSNRVDILKLVPSEEELFDFLHTIKYQTEMQNQLSNYSKAIHALVIKKLTGEK